MKHVHPANDVSGPVLATRDLFDVCRDNRTLCGQNGRTGPRQAFETEIVAYAEWLAIRAGLIPLSDSYICGAGYLRHGKRSPVKGVTFGSKMRVGGEYEAGSFSVPFPGRNAHRDRVTMETLDEAGEVVASSSMPLEPKKGGVIWDKAAVRKACGVQGRGKCPPIPEPVAVPAQEQQPTPPAMSEPAEPVSCASHPEIEPERQIDGEPSPVPAETDVGGDLAARVAALETMLQVFMADKAAPPVSVERAPARAKRSPAHERAVRRAWKERGEARRARDGVASFRHFYEAEECRTRDLRDQLEAVTAELAAFKRLMPGDVVARPDDLARLIDERDEARARLASVEEKARQGAHIHAMVAESLEQMTSRAHRAEAALRDLERLPRPFMVKPSAVTFAPRLAA